MNSDDLQSFLGFIVAACLLAAALLFAVVAIPIAIAALIGFLIYLIYQYHTRKNPLDEAHALREQIEALEPRTELELCAAIHAKLDQDPYLNYAIGEIIAWEGLSAPVFPKTDDAISIARYRDQAKISGGGLALDGRGGEGQVMKASVAISAILAALIFAWYLVADRITPYTSNVRVKAMVIDIVPEISGRVTAVAVNNGQVVESGDLLARIDPRPFQLKVNRARAALDLATQSVGAGSSAIEVAVANLATARINLKNVEAQTARTLKLESRGVVSSARGDNARATLKTSQSAVVAAEADLERERRELGVEGADNPQIREAVAALGEAELALEWAELRAPDRGVVVDLGVTKGIFARAGSRLLTFVSFEEVWVEAYMKENNIANIDIGDPAEISLDLYPGRIFNGVVASITYAASDGTGDGGLPRAPGSSGWMRDPQRFPVRITMPGYKVGSEAVDIRRMVNGQADVIVYTGENGFLNALGAAWMRLMSVISYAY